MTAHVFVVSKETFPIHLKYMFAGTGAGDDGHENLGMISDVASCREGDKILFFVTGVGFFGSFIVKKEYFLDKTGDTYMDCINKKGEKEIIKKLTNRILIEPNEVYSYGISEWDILDNISNLPNGKNSKIQDFLWSLLYRKLDGNRGCTPIFDYEYDFIMQKIKERNTSIKITFDGYTFENSFIKEGFSKEYNSDKILEGIVLKDLLNGSYKYTIEQKISIIKGGEKNKKIQSKTSTGKIRTQWQCEGELELFFSAYGNTHNPQGKEISKVIGTNITYFGTQVVCSFGAKRIDMLTIDKEEIIRVIELKDKEYYDGIIDEQLKYYLSWVDQYIKSDEKKNIEPVIVINKTEGLDYVEVNNKVIDLVKENKIQSKVLPIKIFFWNIESGSIKFSLFK